MWSWREYYMQHEQRQARQMEAARRRFVRQVCRAVPAPADPWNALRIRLGNLLIVWGRWLQRPLDTGPAVPH